MKSWGGSSTASSPDMRVYRICRAERVATALTPLGAASYPCRWNSKGVHLVYTPGSHSLALLEMLVHVNTLHDVPDHLRLLSYDLPDACVHDLEPAHCRTGWDRLPYRQAVRRVGDDFIPAGAHLALHVPSAIVPGESNLLINPRHADIARVTEADNMPLSPDPRLFG
jgi:RES domain-containing protein